MAKFSLGQIVATPPALRMLEKCGQSAIEFLGRHVRGDWGDMTAHDKAANEAALRNGGRIFSSYRTKDGGKLWVITESTDDEGVRRSTCVLTPSEY